ncbi:2'-5' RNA ligase family protein [Niabella ginsengisoli]|uniref:2'-5' RNA ligase family protein n=1 Tax=Niabella ginsengisoli TaxID=522298 RepID=A0ABS9SDU5_9BACT|nr:2'-5' RNA ligase family protein [Niabella ginsengisoli]MCH5596523.1 2'-5' RNA ligase family protein [Niabella ginsengisoli]
MKNIINTYDSLNDYRLIVDLPASVKRKIADIKVEFDADYKGLVIPGGDPFVYLASFAQTESKEDSVVDILNKIALGFMPFKMHLKNFGHIESGEIFIEVEEQAALKMLIGQIKDNLSYVQDARFNPHPRITLAKRLLPFQVSKSWKVYERKSFSATYIANEMLLLKRMEGFSSWQILRRMEFQNMLISV